ncbi:MAG TPA: response regulator [Candidatus Acidoferrales bacterium]|nr:response regulator [Candidatus Acidoferrales bacterium]
MPSRFERLFYFPTPKEPSAGSSQTPVSKTAVATETLTRQTASPARSAVAPAMPLENIHIHLDAPAAKPASRPVAPKQDRRHRRRVKISAPVRIRQVNAREVTDYDFTMTTDVSREGLLFESANATYERGQEVAVVFPYRPAPGDPVKEQRGIVVRVARASERRYGVAIAFVEGEPEAEIVDTSGRPIAQANDMLVSGGRKQFIIVVEADAHQRGCLRSELERQGYAVDAVANASEAMSIARNHQPAAIICEAEPGVGAAEAKLNEMSGYDLCVVVRRNPKLARTPVVLTTRTGMPSDFATAHALGATVCVAKPYELARMSNVLRMLLPSVPR